MAAKIAKKTTISAANLHTADYKGIWLASERLRTRHGRGNHPGARDRHLEHGRHGGRRARTRLPRCRLAVDLGMTVVDTAEMYGNGAAEELVAEALGRSPRARSSSSARCCRSTRARRGTIAACEASLRRLKTDRLDMYLLHWRGSVPLDGNARGVRQAEARRKDPPLGCQQLRRRRHGRARRRSTKRDRTLVATNQVLYNLTRRGIEYDLLPWCRSARHSGDGVLAARTGTPRHGARRFARSPTRLGATPAQVALAWVLRQPGVMAIPKSGRVEHVRENHGALDLQLAPEDLAELDDAFPPPTRKIPLEMHLTGDSVNYCATTLDTYDSDPHADQIFFRLRRACRCC